MSKIKFPQGMRAYRPPMHAPRHAVTALTLDVEEFIAFLREQKSDVVRLNVLASKGSGHHYVCVNEWRPGNPVQEEARAKRAPKPQPDHHDYEDHSVPLNDEDIPF